MRISELNDPENSLLTTTSEKNSRNETLDLLCKNNIHFVNLDDIKKEISSVPKYKQKVVMPDGKELDNELDSCIEQYKNTATSNLNIKLFHVIHHEYKTINIYMIPEVESA